MTSTLTETGPAGAWTDTTGTNGTDRPGTTGPQADETGQSPGITGESAQTGETETAAGTRDWDHPGSGSESPEAGTETTGSTPGLEQDSDHAGSGSESSTTEGGKGEPPARVTGTGGEGHTIASTTGDPMHQATPGAGRSTSAVSQRISANSKLFYRLVMAALALMAMAAFYISFYSIMSFAHTVGFPLYVAWAFPAFIDIAILVSVATILMAKGDGRSTWKSWLSLMLFSSLSVATNVLHAVSLDNTDPVYAVGAAVLAASVPIGVLFATEHTADSAIDSPWVKRRDLKAQAELDDEEAERQRERELKAAEHQLKLARLQKTTEAQIETEVKTITSAAAEDSAPADEPKRQGQSTMTSVDVQGGDQEAGQVDDYAGRPRGEWIDEVAEFIQSRTLAGEDTTTGDVHQAFPGCSRKTAQRQLKELSETRPEIFLTQTPDAEGLAAQPSGAVNGDAGRS